MSHSIEVVGNSLSAVVDKLNSALESAMPIGFVFLDVDFETKYLRDGLSVHPLVSGKIKVASANGRYPELLYVEALDLDCAQALVRKHCNWAPIATFVHSQQSLTKVRDLPYGEWACPIAEGDPVKETVETVWILSR